jgi:patatin-like phospholipase/acyl hydrolase
MVDLYRKDGPKIFLRSPLHRIGALGNLLEEKYPSAGVDEVLTAHFGQAMLSEALTRVFVTSYDIEAREPYFFKSHRATRDPRRDHLMRDAARATSAAPTYFEPAKIPSREPRGYKALVDGGVYANNPSVCAIVEALCEFGATLEDIVMLSLGTGELTRPIRYDDARTWGLAKWAQPVLNVVFDGVSDTVDYQVQSLLTRGGALGGYLRIQPTLTDANDDMDDASEANLQRLEALALRVLGQNDAGLDALAARLTAAPAAGPAVVASAATTQPAAPVAPPT